MDQISDAQKQLMDILDFQYPPKPPKINETWVIKYKGTIIRLPSGKSTWKKIGHAKSAFTNYLDGYKFERIKHVREIAKELVENGILEFKRIDGTEN